MENLRQMSSPLLPQSSDVLKSSHFHTPPMVWNNEGYEMPSCTPPRTAHSPTTPDWLRYEGYEEGAQFLLAEVQGVV